MKIWLTTDTHFYHSKMLEYEYRPKDFNEKIFKGLMEIPEDSMLIHLGDLCIGRDLEVMETFIRPLRCKKVLIRGNHDKKSIDWYIRNGFDSVFDMMWLNAFNKKILFSHKPQEDIGYDVNIHGHCHSKKRKLEFEPMMNDKQKLLALESTNYQPVKLETFLNSK